MFLACRLLGVSSLACHRSHQSDVGASVRLFVVVVVLGLAAEAVDEDANGDGGEQAHNNGDDKTSA